jgi:ribonuclease P/MRP protein subunit RPP40
MHKAYLPSEKSPNPAPSDQKYIKVDEIFKQQVSDRKADIITISESSSYLFADNTKIFRTIVKQEDREILQSDLTKLQEWSDQWLLRFHPAKCKSMTIGKATESDWSYKFYTNEGPHNLDKIDEEKDIGVIIDKNLDFEAHINEKVNKATKIFGIIRRAYLNLNEENFMPLYKALVRSHLDFASAVWSPYKQKHKDLIENVQRRATKQIPSLKELTYEERLRKLKLPSLSYRRIRGDMIELYKILHEKYYKKAAPVLSLRKNVAREALRGHEFALYQKRYNKPLRKIPSL